MDGSDCPMTGNRVPDPSPRVSCCVPRRRLPREVIGWKAPLVHQIGRLPSPWIEFLSDLDDMLKEPLDLHCIGGLVLAHFYGVPRSTGDIDYYTAIPANLNLDAIATRLPSA